MWQQETQLRLIVRMDGRKVCGCRSQCFTTHQNRTPTHCHKSLCKYRRSYRFLESFSTGSLQKTRMCGTFAKFDEKSKVLTWSSVFFVCKKRSFVDKLTHTTTLATRVALARVAIARPCTIRRARYFGWVICGSVCCVGCFLWNVKHWTPTKKTNHCSHFRPN